MAESAPAIPVIYWKETRTRCGPRMWLGLRRAASRRGRRATRNWPPDLAVEVKSPRNSYAELAAKAGMWLSYGSREVWVADPERVTLTVYRPYQEPLVLGEDDTLEGGDLLPGFATPVWQLFRQER